MKPAPGRLGRLVSDRMAVSLLFVLALAAAPAGAQPAYADQVDRSHVVFTIGSPEIAESSSLAVSTVDPGLIYTTNDSGDAGTVYSLDAKTGAVVGRTTLAGAAPLDVEAIAAGSDGSLIVADIGDNDADHSTADLYRIDQPGRGDQSVTPDRVDLTYLGGPRDAESVVYDADSGRAFVVSKLLGGAKVYGTPPHVFDYQRARLRPVAAAPPVATDATFLPGDELVAVRTYTDAMVYSYPSWESVASFDLPPQQQGESITAPASGGVVWVGSEGTGSDVLAVTLPNLLDLSSPSDPNGSAPPSHPSETTPASGDGTTGSDASDASGPPGDSETTAQHLAQVVFVISAAALLAILVGLVLVLVTLSRRRRH